MRFLFFDDYLLHRTHNLVRLYHQPRWRPEHLFTVQNAYGASGGSVAPAPDGGLYMYYLTSENADNPDDALAYYMARSEDGLEWTRMTEADGAPAPRDPRSGGVVYYDPDDPDPTRLYKAPILLSSQATPEGGPGDPHDPAQWTGYIKCSADGLHWTMDPEHVYFRGVSDTHMGILRNPVTGRYQVMVRASLGNRRIFVVDSPDLKRWSGPRLVLHPCPPDPRGTFYYGMPQFRYGDLFLGFLQVYQTTDDDPGMGRMMGSVTTELAFSYDGLYWMRTRQPFMPLLGRGAYGGGSMYGQMLLDRGGDTLLVYACACLEEHHYALNRDPGKPPLCAVLPGTLRRDGFVGLATTGGPGELATYQLPVTPEGGLSLNVHAPYGGVRIQLSDEAYRAIPGYSFEECEEVHGDHIRVSPRWRTQADLGEACRRERFLRIQVRLDQAELFSMTFDMGGNPYVIPVV